MKKPNQLVLLFSIVMIGLLSSCAGEPKKSKSNEAEPSMLTESKEQAEGTFCYTDKGRPNNMLKYSEIVTMLEAYDKTRKPVLEKILGKEDTRINTYSLESLQAYLGYIQNLAEKKGIPITGINIISAAYPKNSGGKYEGYQTLIFMPTTKIGDDQFVTFDPLKSKKGIPVTFKSLLAKKGYKWGYDKSEIIDIQKASILNLEAYDDDDSSGSNKLGLIPPGGN